MGCVLWKKIVFAVRKNFNSFGNNKFKKYVKNIENAMFKALKISTGIVYYGKIFINDLEQYITVNSNHTGYL